MRLAEERQRSHPREDLMSRSNLNDNTIFCHPSKLKWYKKRNLKNNKRTEQYIIRSSFDGN